MALRRVGLARYRPVTLLVVPDVRRLDAAASKAGKLPSITKTIGEAFDAAFPGGTWSADTAFAGLVFSAFGGVSANSE
jgi:hypothetical protein